MTSKIEKENPELTSLQEQIETLSTEKRQIFSREILGKIMENLVKREDFKAKNIDELDSALVTTVMYSLNKLFNIADSGRIKQSCVQKGWKVNLLGDLSEPPKSLPSLNKEDFEKMVVDNLKQDPYVVKKLQEVKQGGAKPQDEVKPNAPMV